MRHRGEHPRVPEGQGCRRADRSGHGDNASSRRRGGRRIVEQRTSDLDGSEPVGHRVVQEQRDDRGALGEVLDAANIGQDVHFPRRCGQIETAFLRRREHPMQLAARGRSDRLVPDVVVRVDVRLHPVGEVEVRRHAVQTSGERRCAMQTFPDPGDGVFTGTDRSLACPGVEHVETHHGRRRGFGVGVPHEDVERIPRGQSDSASACHRDGSLPGRPLLVPLD
ncbi:hypothetical protein NJ76_12290 [Rhodococcus sp. IITR03]|nr:hypothetical protein NJ76_12290 [Rhodococcus sp. IITR03]